MRIKPMCNQDPNKERLEELAPTSHHIAVEKAKVGKLQAKMAATKAGKEGKHKRGETFCKIDRWGASHGSPHTCNV